MVLNKIRNLLLIGCGKMGSAMLDVWIKQSAFTTAHIINLETPPMAKTAPDNCHFYSSLNDYKVSETSNPDVVILAVKPQVIQVVMEEITQTKLDAELYLSIIAGKPLHFFENFLSSDAAVIRSMPNTPAAIGKGITALFGNKNANQNHLEIAQRLLSACGDVEILDDENLMDAVTALSGSGPAYIYLMIEAMTDAGVQLGLSKEIAGNLARKTVIGAAYLAESESETSAEQLRKNVTSPGGTTEAALNILMNHDPSLHSLMGKALQAAKHRSIELAS